MNSPIAPAWIVLPLATGAMLLTAGYLIALREAPHADEIMTPRRRRLRTVSGWLILVTLPLTAAGFGLIPPADQRTFVIVWIIATALLSLILILGLIDLADVSHQRHRIYKDAKHKLDKARSELDRIIGAHPEGSDDDDSK